MTAPPRRVDAIVVGGGPAGAAAGYWLAQLGRETVIVERKTFPRDKSCGDALTPRAVRQLRLMGLEDKVIANGYHRYDGLRACAHGITIELPWPEHPLFPRHGYVIRRTVLDQMVAEHAESAGAELWQGFDAVAPLLDDGLLRGAIVQDKATGETSEVHARYVVVADGAVSKFARALGATRNRRFPMGMAIRQYFQSPMHDDPWIESTLDVRDRQGRSMPGYGWVFPLSDGTINVGIGLLSTYKHYKSVNTSTMMAEFAATAPDYWGISPETTCGPPLGGRLPMWGALSPLVGPTWALIGDAAGTINPFNGEGIDYAYETGKIVADLIDQSLTEGDARPLQRYPEVLEDEYGLYFKVARLFARVIGSNPRLLLELTRIGMHSRPLMEWVLIIMAHMLKEEDKGAAELVYQTVALLARAIPEPGAA
ncbi:MAG: geranylgeranyl reductase family protein [Acidimicrobiia bacterium]